MIHTISNTSSAFCTQPDTPSLQAIRLSKNITKVPDKAESVTVYNWPYRAVEEALCNAVYHRSYQIHEMVTVTVTPEKLDILSIPGPDASISDEDLKNRVLISSRYRKRLLDVRCSNREPFRLSFHSPSKILPGDNQPSPKLSVSLCFLWFSFGQFCIHAFQ